MFPIYSHMKPVAPSTEMSCDFKVEWNERAYTPLANCILLLFLVHFIRISPYDTAAVRDSLLHTDEVE